MKSEKVIKPFILSSLILFFTTYNAIAVERLKIHEKSIDDNKSAILESWNSTENKLTLIGLSEENDARSLEIPQLFKEKGLIGIKYQQYYKGIPVHNAFLSFISKDNQPKILIGNVVHGIAMNSEDITPIFKPIESLNYLKEKRAEQKELENPIRFESEKSELMIYLDEKDQLRLVHHVSFFYKDSAGKISRPFYIIDAKTKEIIKEWEGLRESRVMAESVGGNTTNGDLQFDPDTLTDYDAVSGTYKDWPKLNTNYNSQTQKCELVDDNIRIINDPDVYYQNPTWYYKTFDYDCYIPGDGVNGGYSPASDVYFFAQKTYDMFYDWYGISQPIYLSTPIDFFVHFEGNAPVTENEGFAGWTGSGPYFADEDPNHDDYHPFTSLNVVAHEIAHGFSETYYCLGYVMDSDLARQGIEESFCDFTGEIAEAYVYGSADWKTGSRIRHEPSGYEYRRNLYEPREDCPRDPPLTCHSGYPGYPEGPIGDPLDTINDYTSYVTRHSGNGDYHDIAGIFSKALFNLGAEQWENLWWVYYVMLYTNLYYWVDLADENGVDALNEAAELFYDAAEFLEDEEILQLPLSDITTAFCQVDIYVPGIGTCN